MKRFLMPHKIPSPADSGPWIAAVTNQRGQSLVEGGIAILVFVMLCMGMVEFGRAWMVSNVIVHAARDGARAAAIVPSDHRVNGIIGGNDISSIVAQMETQIHNALPDTSSFNTSTGSPPVVTQVNVGGIDVVKVTVTGTVPYVFNLPGVGPSFTINRTVVFDDAPR